MNDQSQNHLLIIAICFVALSLLGLLILLYLMFRLLRGIFRIWSRGDGLFGEDLRTRLISLGLATLFFPAVLPSFIGAMINLVVRLFRDVLVELPRNWEFIRQMCGRDSETTNCIAQSGIFFLTGWGRAVANVILSLEPVALPWGQLVLMLALWAVIARFLSPGAADQSGTATGHWRIYDALAGLRPVTRQNMIFFLVLALAGYLSVAAITAIPGLRQTSPEAEQVNPEKLKQQLEEVRQQAEINLNRELKSINPFTPLEEVISRSDRQKETEAAKPAAQASPSPSPQNIQPTGTQASATPQTGQKTDAAAQPSPSAPAIPTPVQAVDIEYVKPLLLRHKGMRDDLLNEYRNLVQNAQARLKDTQSAIVSTYEASNAYRIGGREKVQHFLALSAFYRQKVSEFESRINACGSAVGSNDIYWRIWSSQLQDALTHGRELPDDVIFGATLSESYRKTLDSCRPVLSLEGLPERPALGSFLGPFGFVARWLLSTESLSLALITGLLGFGLLGSACSTFVRERVRRGNDGVLVADLPGVVIRGLSAAIVVFLAVEGGLAIFASSGSEPNPYVLLLTCLVAAVFSEDVWRWAHRKLLENFSSSEHSASPRKGSHDEPGSAEKAEHSTGAEHQHPPPPAADQQP
ncbi:MAG: hypothetical protein U0Z53_05460 [Blastocatellia bacterium]